MVARENTRRTLPAPGNRSETIVHETDLSWPHDTPPDPSRNPCPLSTSRKVRSRYCPSMAWVGYGRVSAHDQHPESQQDALTAADRDRIFVDHASATLARRPALDDANGT